RGDPHRGAFHQGTFVRCWSPGDGARSTLDDDTSRLLKACPKGISNFVGCIRSLALLPAEHTRSPRNDWNCCADPPCRAGSKGVPHELSKTVGLAVAISPVAGAVAAGADQWSRSGPPNRERGSDRLSSA